MAGALAAVYRRVPFVHVEAGLRTGTLSAPWPEELNRRVAAVATTLHCAPTPRAESNLLGEGIPRDAVHVTGNTAIDALLWTLERERKHGDRWQQKYDWLEGRRLVLVTAHRRENLGKPLREICRAVATLAQKFRDVVFLYPVHLNPEVQESVRESLSDIPNIVLSPPVWYPEFVWLMDRALLLMTDSGGVQEEAPSLRKPVLVLRDVTERPEAVEIGAAELVGTAAERIVPAVTRLLMDVREYRKRQASRNPFGDGRAAERIVGLIQAAEWSNGES